MSIKTKAAPAIQSRTEAEIQRAAIRGLQARGFIVLRVNSGGFKNTATGSYLRAYTICGLEKSAGFPDLVAFRLRALAENPCGGDAVEAVLIEVKDAKGKLSESQKLFHEYAAARGVIVHVLRHPDELDAILGGQ